MINVITFIIAYLIGSLSFAVLISRAMNLSDPRTYGSLNPGATNVLRSGNKLAAIFTLLGDAFKGWIVVWGVKKIAIIYGFSEITVALAIIAVFMGHLYPIYFRFKGGKGVATSAGILLAIHPLLGIAAILSWLIIAALSRYSSLAALMTAMLAPIYGFFLVDSAFVLLAVCVISLLLIWRHKLNIANLASGKEKKIKLGKKSALSP